jgi:hypothetical protein
MKGRSLVSVDEGALLGKGDYDSVVRWVEG